MSYFTCTLLLCNFTLVASDYAIFYSYIYHIHYKDKIYVASPEEGFYKAEILYTSLRKQHCIFCLQPAPIITFVLYVFQGLQPNICKIVSFYSPIL